MSDLIHQPTQTTKSGISETKRKPGRPTKITEHIRDLEDEAPIDPKKIATAEDFETVYPKPVIVNFGLGVVKSYEEFYRALDAARMRDDFDDEKYIELTPEMFKMVTKGQECEVMIHGEPPVWIYVVGSRSLIKKNHKRKADELPLKE